MPVYVVGPMTTIEQSLTDTMTLIPHSKPSLGQGRNYESSDRGASVGPDHCRAHGGRNLNEGIAAYIGLHGGVAVSSGTVALELALRALGVGHGDNVIPSYVCSAPGWLCNRSAPEARLVDINPTTYNLDPQKVRKAPANRTRAVIVPPYVRPAGSLTSLQSLDIPLIEDCAQTLGAMEQGRGRRLEP